ncbi:hypothetical protein TRICI_004244 [Trichomonascus ciferrii]|uniref:Choline monooxygenase, chloroplastic n=1 Tax=Trichomonascus ciferrii TaxID=44093 RepID=A0A642V0V8_9ASCO|nr:hypothetical protein TRICI_004244 [Trichomonascus ciferrii]
METEAYRTLPASWYVSPKLYELEQDVIFKKGWHLVGPITKFTETPIDYEIAGNAFQVQKQPDSDVVEVYYVNDKGVQTSPVRFEQSRTGLVFVCFDDNAPSMEEYFGGQLTELIDSVDFTKLPYRRSIKYTGKFNWKTMIDGYQECLHCKYTHPSFYKRYPSEFYAVENYTNFSRHLQDPAYREDGLFLFFFPICTLNVYGGGMSMFRTCPISATECRMEFDYYYNGSDEDFEEYYNFTRKVATEDYDLCVDAQKNLERGIYQTGILNPNKENGVLYYQGLVKDKVLDAVAAK